MAGGGDGVVRDGRDPDLMDGRDGSGDRAMTGVPSGRRLLQSLSPWNSSHRSVAGDAAWTLPRLSRRRDRGCPHMANVSEIQTPRQLKHYKSVHWALDAGRNLGADTRLRLYGEGADERMLGRLIAKAVSRGLAPFSLLPVEADMFWGGWGIDLGADVLV
eukprot:Skav223313  [mRNA]  locus=scaffold200:30445:31609:+ [translate_table: standard]